MPTVDPSRKRRQEAEGRLRAIAHEEKMGLRKFAERPEQLFHYTDAAGLAGILSKGGCFWMRSDEEAKDPLELRYANQVFREAWSAAADPDGGMDGLDLAASNPYLPSNGLPATYGIYLASFCTRGDIPHHWQNFAAGGRGFSIGIATPAQDSNGWTTSAAKKTHLLIEPVIYGREPQQRILTRLFKEARSMVAAIGFKDVQAAVRQVMGEVLPFYKDESFSREVEWRFVATRLSDFTPDDADVQVREGRLAAVLELRHKPAPLPISEVVVGPRMAGAAPHIEALLTKAGLSKVEVQASHWQA
jgi:hypothetical protein